MLLSTITATNLINKLKRGENNMVTEHKNEKLLHTLKNSVYPEASDTSIELVINYCEKIKVDPLQKPVHLVPMWDKVTKTFKDTIMPGIGLYRIQAARSGYCLGISEPEFGPIITKTLTKTEKAKDGRITGKKDVEVTFPEWCKVTIKKITNNHIGEITATEYWLENYAPANKDSSAPNSMWAKRPFGQLGKCAEAQALRKAFPEIITQAPTVEEMEGKFFKDEKNEQVVQADITQEIDNNIMRYLGKQIEEKEDTKTPSLEDKLRDLIEKHNISDDEQLKWLKKANVTYFSEFTIEQLHSCITFIKDKYEQKK